MLWLISFNKGRWLILLGVFALFINGQGIWTFLNRDAFAGWAGGLGCLVLFPRERASLGVFCLKQVELSARGVSKIFLKQEYLLAPLSTLRSCARSHQVSDKYTCVSWKANVFEMLRHVFVPFSGFEENNIIGVFHPGAPLAPLYPKYQVWMFSSAPSKLESRWKVIKLTLLSFKRRLHSVVSVISPANRP